MLLQKIAADRYLERYPVYKLFSVPVREKLIVHMIAKDEYLFRADEPVNRLYFLVEGRAKTYVAHENGTETLLAFLSEGTIMGDMELVGAQTESYMVKATERCFAIELPLDDCREAVLRDAKFMLLLCRVIGNKLHYNDMRFSAMQAYSLKTRLAAFLLASRSGNMFYELQTATAQYIGASYRHIQRMFASLCKEGVLKRDVKGFNILHPEILCEYADGVNVFQTSKGFLDYIK